MPVQARFRARRGLSVLWGVCAVAALQGCGSFDGAGQRLANTITPYRVDVVQGNFVSREQVEALTPGMSRQQVRDLLGSPLITSLFHADRWDYVFNLKRPGVEVQTRRLTVFFKGDLLERFEGDEMPTESEFVATLGSRKALPKVPVLEATPEQLARFPAPAPAAPEAAADAPAGAARTTPYPPLEPAGR